MKAVIKETIQTIKDAGFSHIKVELEGDIGRDGERDCDYCYGEGREECSECSGSGQVETEETGNLGEEEFEDCPECYGDGMIMCAECEGEGNLGEYRDEDTCEQIMRDNVPREVLDRLVYGHFYEDGSVDSEFTFTVAIEDAPDILHWIDSFKALAEEINGYGNGGNGIDVSGAGMHITLLPNGDYDNMSQLDRAGLRNFQTEVEKLLPALFFIASAGHQSRDLSYRMPRVSTEEKYSAIYLHDGYCIEYRLFETCYDRPEAIWDYLQAIAQTLKFYTNPNLHIKTLGKRFGFSDGDNLARFYNTPEQLRILNATIKEIKPKDKSFKKLKAERGVHYTLKELGLKEKKRMAQLREDYQQYVRRAKEVISRPLTTVEQRRVDWYMTEDGLSREDAISAVRGVRSRVEDFRTFVENNTRNDRYDMMAVTV